MASAAPNLQLPGMLVEQLVNEQERLQFKLELASVAQRATPHPEPDSDHEVQLAAEMYAISLRLFIGLGRKAVDILRADINQQLAALLADEYATTESIRKLAFAQLREAVGVLGKFVERVASAMAELSYEVLIQLFEETLGDRETLLTQLRGDVSFRYLAVTSLAIMIGLELPPGNLQEFTYWATRAVESSRRAEPVLTELVPTLKGDVARVRAQYAWTHWDQTEIDRELNSWKNLDQ
jgi:hypothetical protein